MLNLILGARTFTETLLYDLVLLVIVFIAVYILANRGKSRKGKHALRKLDSVLGKFIIVLSITILLLGLLPLNTIERLSLYFILQGISAWIILTLYVREKVSNSVAIFYTVISFLSIPIIIYFKNVFYPRYSIVQESLYVAGSLEPYMKGSAEGGFYYFIPVDPLIMVPLAYFCGEDISFLLPVIRNLILYLVIVLSIFAIIRRTGLRAFYASILTYAIAPTLSFQDRILSLPYVTLVLYILFLAINSGKLSSELSIILAVLSAVSVFAHPVGPITLIFMLLLLILLSRVKGRYEKIYVISSSILKLFALIAFTYWFLTYLYTLLTTKTLRLAEATIRFINSLFGVGEAHEVFLGYTISTYSAPGYSDPKFYTYAYVWALPIAVATSFFLLSLIEMLAKKRAREVDEVTILGLASSLSTLMLIGTAYIGYAMNVEPGQYLIPAGYYASTLIIGIALYKYSKVREPAFTVFAVLIALGVGLGLYSPNWAPLEHPDFKSSIIMFPYINYVEAACVADHLNENLAVYSVHDFPIGARGKMPNYVLDQIRLGNVVMFNGVIVGIGINDQILKTQVQHISLLYSTGKHVLALVTS